MSEHRRNQFDEDVAGWTEKELIHHLSALGLQSGDVVNVKASLRSIGFIDGGARTLIDALLYVVGPEGTIVTDSFVRCYQLPLVRRKHRIPVGDNTSSYAGALANEMLKHPHSVRSNHPIQKFALIGHHAREWAQKHTRNANAYAVLAEVSRHGGKNLRIGPMVKVPGVGTTHVAINQLGFSQVRFRCGRRSTSQNGMLDTFVINWPGGCPVGFRNFEPLYEAGDAILASGHVGQAESVVTSMATTLAIELEALRRDPGIMLCTSPDCLNCRATWTFSDDTPISFGVKQGLKGQFRRAAGSLLLSITGTWCVGTDAPMFLDRNA